jgi:hypothetical protein
MPHECFHDPRGHNAIGQLTACAIATCSGPLSASGYTSFFFAQGDAILYGQQPDSPIFSFPQMKPLALNPACPEAAPR